MEREWNERPTFEVGWLLKCKGCGATFTDTPPGFEKGYCHYCWVNRAEAAEARVRELEQTVVDMRDALRWCSGSPNFAPEGEARKGWVKLVEPLLDGDGQKVGER